MIHQILLLWILMLRTGQFFPQYVFLRPLAFMAVYESGVGRAECQGRGTFIDRYGNFAMTVKIVGIEA